MGSFSLMNIGASALLANQALLTTTGNNIANVNTPGYSTETAQLSAQSGPNTGAGYFGTGVNIASVQRTYSQFLATAANQAQSVSSADSARSSLQNQLQQLFPIGSGSLGSAINTVFSDYTNLASNPTDSAAQTTLLSDLNNLSSTFNSTSSQLSGIQTQVTQQMGSDAQQVTSLSQQIAQVNQQILQQSSTGQPPNTLMDQRDQLISQLNKYVQTSTVVAANGNYNIFVAGGQPLVIGATSATMSVTPSTGNSAQSALQLTLPGGQIATLNPAYLGGGDLNGLMQFQNNDLSLAQNTVGQMALTTASLLNSQQNLGNGTQSTPLFNLSVNGTAASTNTSGAILQATLTSASSSATAAQSAMSPYQLQSTYNAAAAATGAPMGYSVAYDNTTSAWTLTNIQTPSDSTTFSAAAAPATGMTANLDGLTFSLSTTPNVDDTFNINPSATAAAQIQTAITSPKQISASPLSLGFSTSATASPASTLAVQSLALTSGSASSAVNPNVTNPVTISFSVSGTPPVTTYSVSGVGTTNPTNLSYTPGQAISYNGWTLTPTGTPANGDVLTVQPFQSIGSTPIPGLGGDTLNDSYATALSSIGTMVQSGSTAATLSASMATSATQAASNVSGVNLDEEASNLLQYQQSYQAAAKIISVASAIFDSLIQAVNS